jgi:hypothetical protein
MKRQPVKVEWVFAKKEEIKTIPNIDGKPLRCVPHQFAPEGIPTKRIYCYGCGFYFADWGKILRYHKLKGATVEADKAVHPGSRAKGKGATKHDNKNTPRSGMVGRGRKK